MTLSSCFVLRLFYPSITVGESDPLVIVCCCDQCGAAFWAEIQDDGISLNIAIDYPKATIFFIPPFDGEVIFVCNHLSCSIGMVGI